MKTSLFLFLGLPCAFLAGCATPFRAPPDVAHLQLERVDSPVVMVTKIWLEKKEGPLVVTGYVIKRLSADDTAQTHLDITLYDTAGRTLRNTVEHFEPRQIPRGRRMPDSGTYRVTLARSHPAPPESKFSRTTARTGSRPKLGRDRLLSLG
jgi:hypothetical protein